MHIISNERRVNKIIQELRTTALSDTHRNRRFALIIGEGSLTSMLPELSALCDGVILVDINPLVNKHSQLMLELLLQSEDREEFKSLYKEHAAKYASYELEEHEKWWDLGAIVLKKLLSRGKDLKADFFLSSQKRFLQCKNVAKQLTFDFLRMNVFHLEEVEKLKEDLTVEKISISVINVSNLYEWDADKNILNCTKAADWRPLANMVNCLLDASSDHIILYSAYEEKDNMGLVAKMVRKTKDYLDAAEEAIQMQISAYEQHCHLHNSRIDTPLNNRTYKPC